MRPADQELEALADKVGQALRARGWRVATAESCTGGWIGKALTDVPGSSSWFEGGLTTYSNAAKAQLLGVPSEVLTAHGAVSEDTVRAMAEGARERFKSDVAVAVSGIAGPGGGSMERPVGLVWLAWAAPNGVSVQRHVFAGNRDAVRRRTVAVALERLIDLVWLDERPA